MVAALRDLIDAHVAITRWPTSKRTGDEHGIARQTDRAQHRIEQLSCRTGERQALSVSLLIRRTADDHPIGSPITGSEHRLRAPLVQPTAPAVAHIALECRPPGQRHRRLGCGYEYGCGCGCATQYPVIDAEHAEIGGAALRVSHGGSPSCDQPGAAGGAVPPGRRSRRNSHTVGADSTYIVKRNSSIGGGSATTNASDSGTITK